MVSPDYEDLFRTLNAHRVKYLVIGAHAVMFYTEPRFSKDMDVWIPSALNDPQRVYDALKAFGAPLRDMTPQDFANPDMIFQIGVPPVRIDILMDVPGVLLKQAWNHRAKTRYGRTSINVLGLEELIQAKRAAGRPRDKWDLSKLLRALAKSRKRMR